MKTRIGFVSNSSSSSFVLVGLVFNENEISEKDLMDLIITKEALDSYCMKYYEKPFDKCEEWEQQDARYDCKCDSDIKVLIDGEDGAETGKYAIGVQIAATSDYEFPSRSMDLNDALLPLTEIMMNFKDKKPMIITGTRMT